MVAFRATVKDCEFKEALVFHVESHIAHIVIVDKSCERFGEITTLPINILKLTKEQIHKMEANHGR